MTNLDRYLTKLARSSDRNVSKTGLTTSFKSQKRGKRGKTMNTGKRFEKCAYRILKFLSKREDVGSALDFAFLAKFF